MIKVGKNPLIHECVIISDLCRLFVWLHYVPKWDPCVFSPCTHTEALGQTTWVERNMKGLNSKYGSKFSEHEALVNGVFTLADTDSDTTQILIDTFMKKYSYCNETESPTLIPIGYCPILSVLVSVSVSISANVKIPQGTDKAYTGNPFIWL